MPYGIQAPSGASYAAASPNVLGQLFEMFSPEMRAQRASQLAAQGAQTEATRQGTAWLPDTHAQAWAEQGLRQKALENEMARFGQTLPIDQGRLEAENERNRLIGTGQKQTGDIAAATNQIEQARNDIMGTEARNRGAQIQHEGQLGEDRLALERMSANHAVLQNMPMFLANLEAMSKTLPPEAKAQLQAAAQQMMNGAAPGSDAAGLKTANDQLTTRLQYEMGARDTTPERRHQIQQQLQSMGGQQAPPPVFGGQQGQQTQGQALMHDVGQAAGSYMAPQPNDVGSWLKSFINPVGTALGNVMQGAHEIHDAWTAPVGGQPATTTPTSNRTRQTVNKTSGAASSIPPTATSATQQTGVGLPAGTSDSWVMPNGQPAPIPSHTLMTDPNAPHTQIQFRGAPQSPPLSMMQLQGPGGPASPNVANSQPLGNILRMLGMA